MPKLSNVDTNYMMEVAKRHQKIGWRLGILYAHFYNNESNLDRQEAAQLIQEIQERMTAGEET